MFKLTLTFTAGFLDEVRNILKYLKVKIFNTLRGISKRLLFSTRSKCRKYLKSEISRGFSLWGLNQIRRTGGVRNVRTPYVYALLNNYCLVDVRHSVNT